MEWYEEWFDRAEYQVVYKHRNDAEAEALLDTIGRIVAPSLTDRILDVGCGRGRHSILFKKHGFNVVGIDLSEESIKEARSRARDENLDIEFEVLDMRDQYCSQCVDGIVNLFTAFGYFRSEVEHLAALQSIVGSLRPGGWFVQDFLNASFVRSTLVEEDVRTEGDLTIKQERWIDAGRINKRITLTTPADSQHFDESVRLLTLDDFKRMYAEAGLDIFATLGDYQGNAYVDDSPRLILCSRKRG